MITDKKGLSWTQKTAKNFIKDIQKEKDTKSKIGWVCTYTPEELILSAGALPYRILSKAPLNDDKGYLPINFCPFIKSILQQVFSEDDLKAIVIANSCDGLRRLYDIIDYYKKDIEVFLLDVPRNTDKLSVRHFFSNLVRLNLFLQGCGTSEEAVSLYDAVKIVSIKKKLLKSLKEVYLTDPEVLTFSDYEKIVELSMIKDPFMLVPRLEGLLEELDKKDVGTRAGHKYTDIYLSGSFVMEEKLWGLFDELGLKIVDDDLCSAKRYFSNVIRPLKNISLDDSIMSISESYLKKTPCMRMADLSIKLDEIKEGIRKTEAKGFIYISMKFCDNSLLFYPLLKEGLRDFGIPSLFLELETNNFPEGQVKTRLQAFKELMI